MLMVLGEPAVLPLSIAFLLLLVTVPVTFWLKKLSLNVFCWNPCSIRQF